MRHARRPEQRAVSPAQGPTHGAGARGLVIRGLSKTYYDLYTGQHVAALEDVSLVIEPGEFVSILGPSGCGKSTLLNIVAGFIPPTTGEVILNGRRIQGPGPDRGVVFQSFALFPWKTVLENVGFGLKMRGVPRAERDRIAREYIALVGLSGFEDRYPHELSGGMQQRVGVARVLANDPELMLMDEPFASVDAQTRMTLQEELTRIWEARRPTILFVTHDVEEAVFLANRVVVLSARPGRVRETVEVALPRPRAWTALIEAPDYKALVARVLGLVRTAPTAA
ncbi:MAG: ABC transporter ATP-binding protein [Armatimonadota bacterium]|nr:ABC transporter ATP-binding protein [Armatimonadota bacterium]